MSFHLFAPHKKKDYICPHNLHDLPIHVPKQSHRIYRPSQRHLHPARCTSPLQRALIACLEHHAHAPLFRPIRPILQRLWRSYSLYHQKDQSPTHSICYNSPTRASPSPTPNRRYQFPSYLLLDRSHPQHPLPLVFVCPFSKQRPLRPASSPI